MGCVKLLLLIAVVGKYYNNESKEEIWYEIIAIGVGGFATSWIGEFKVFKTLKFF